MHGRKAHTELRPQPSQSLRWAADGLPHHRVTNALTTTQNADAWAAKRERQGLMARWEEAVTKQGDVTPEIQVRAPPFFCCE